MAAATTAAATAATAEGEATTSAAQSLPYGGRPDDGAAAVRVSKLFEAHGPTVLGLCRVLLRNQQEAEDATQQTFLAAYRSMLNGAEPRYPAAWLATIARNECWAITERRMREPIGVPAEELEGRLPDPVHAAAAKADLEQLWRAIGELPRQQRQALLLREFSGLSYDELAVALGVSEPAVESLLFRARRHVRVRLRPVYGTAAAAAAPLAAVRDALARTIAGMPDPSAASGLAKIASVPFVAKLAAGTAAVVVAGGTVAAVETHRPGGQPSAPPAAPPVSALADEPVRAAPALSARTTAVVPVLRSRAVRAEVERAPVARSTPTVAAAVSTVPAPVERPAATPPQHRAEDDPTASPPPTPAAPPPAVPAPGAAAAGGGDLPEPSGGSTGSAPDPAAEDPSSGTGSGDLGGGSSGPGSSGEEETGGNSGPGGGGGDDDGSGSGSGSGADGGGSSGGSSGNSGPGGGGDDGTSGGGDDHSGHGGGGGSGGSGGSDD